MIALIAEALFVLARVILAYLESFVRLFVPPVKKDLRGEVVLVTGAGHGIGRCLAIQFAELGCKLVLWDINKVLYIMVCRLDEFHVSVYTNSYSMLP